MSQKASCKILEQKIQALERENAALKRDLAALKDFRDVECIFKTAPIGLAVLVDQKIVRVNRCLCDITGYSMAELTGSDTRIFFPDDASYQKIITQKEDLDVVFGQKSIETRWQTRDGRLIDTRLTYAPIDENDFSRGMTITVQDITTRKRDEESLKFQAKVLNSINDIVRVVNLDGNIVYVNDAHNKIMDLGPHPCLGKKFDELMRGFYLKGSPQSIIDKTVRHGKSNEEVVVSSIDGSTFTLDLKTHLIEDSTSTPYIVGIATNVTEKKKSDRQRELLLAATEQSPQAVFITNSERIIEYVNTASEQQTGFTRQEIVGMNLRVLRSNKHDRQFYINLWAALSTGHMWTGQTINKKKDGSLYTADTTISSVKDDNGAITNYVCVQRDISNEIEIYEKIAQIQKIESLGTLAGGMVHDLNNMLFPILGNTEILLMDSSVHSPKTIEILEQIYESALQAKELVQQVLTFSRHKKIERYPLHIQDSIDIVLKLMKHGIPRSVSIEKDIDSSSPPVIADPTQIHQIIMNLVSNGLHAMDKAGGVIKISLVPENVDGTGEHDTIRPGNYICLSVSDTGAGMSKEVMNHIFEPFYTTRANGQGTGMGLSVVSGIVKDMGGGIKVYSRLKEGSEFRIYFPCGSIKDIVEQPQPREIKKKISLDRQHQVLFVDDEDVILKVATSMLERLNCHTTTMTDPLDALAHFQENPLGYDLVITDMYMPHMNGDNLAESIREIRPDIPIFFCTGFSDDITVDMISRLGVSAVLAKPLSIKELSDKIEPFLVQ